VTQIGSSLSTLGWSFHASHGSPILELDPDGEIIAIDIERNIDVLRVQVWSGRIMKTSDFATSQD
jgi:hypothetical protein